MLALKMNWDSTKINDNNYRNKDCKLLELRNMIKMEIGRTIHNVEQNND